MRMTYTFSKTKPLSNRTQIAHNALENKHRLLHQNIALVEQQTHLRAKMAKVMQLFVKLTLLIF